MKIKMLVALPALLALTAASSLAAPVNPLVWTAVASTGTIDESSLGFFSFGTTGLTYLSGSASILPVIARYNVTNLAGGAANPAWTQLELGYLDTNAGGAVNASLYRVNPCTGARTLLCQVNSVDNSAGTCLPCSITAGFDFKSFLYYVEVTLTRTTPGAFPQANTLRIY